MKDNKSDSALGLFYNGAPFKYVNDFDLCADAGELKRTIRCIDDNGYTMVSVTQDASGTYTVFFRRPAQE